MKQRAQGLQLARSGTKVAQLAATFGMSDATIYNWLTQEKIDRGEIDGLSCLDEPSHHDTDSVHPPATHSGTTVATTTSRR
jgi:transposase-like protein